MFIRGCFLFLAVHAYGGGLEGRLIGPDGKPGAAGSTISVINGATKHHVSATSDVDGVYRADGLAAGVWIVQAENPDHRYYARKNIQVTADGVTSNVDLRAGSLVLSGVVRDGSVDKPLAGAFVTARHLDPAPDEFLPTTAAISATADDHGAFALPELRPGHYSLNIAGPGRGMVAMSNFEFLASAPLTVVFPDACKITGRVLNEDGEPMEDIGVQAIRVEPAPMVRAYAMTDEDGVFTVLGVGSGLYDVFAQGTEVQPAVARGVAVEVDGENKAGDLTLRGGGGKITGLVTYGGQPLPVVVVARAASSQLELMTRADERGEYVFDHVPAGDYAISFSDPTATDVMVTVTDDAIATLDHSYYGE